jgi:hypothetical protein
LDCTFYENLCTLKSHEVIWKTAYVRKVTIFSCYKRILYLVFYKTAVIYFNGKQNFVFYETKHSRHIQRVTLQRLIAFNSTKYGKVLGILLGKTQKRIVSPNFFFLKRRGLFVFLIVYWWKPVYQREGSYLNVWIKGFQTQISSLPSQKCILLSWLCT